MFPRKPCFITEKGCRKILCRIRKREMVVQSYCVQLQKEEEFYKLTVYDYIIGKVEGL